MLPDVPIQGNDRDDLQNGVLNNPRYRDWEHDPAFAC